MIPLLSKCGPRACGDGPGGGVVAVRRKEWTPRVRGWTRVAAVEQRDPPVDPARAGMDRRPGARTSRRAGGPRACGDGPWHPLWPPPAEWWTPRVRGWTLAARAGISPETVDPARAGMDRVRLARDGRADRGPRACGDGPCHGGMPRYSGKWTPRVRGWTRVPEGLQDGRHVDPARAGMDRPSAGAGPNRSGGPRACGDGPSATDRMVAAVAWTPRVRGWTGHQPVIDTQAEVDPARAGMDRASAASGTPPPSGPRACGDGPALRTPRNADWMWTPRVRGWTGIRLPMYAFSRVDPARAGMDPGGRCTQMCLAGGPRACGDGPGPDLRTQIPVLWTPRVRGWTRGHARQLADDVVDPARAGMDRMGCSSPPSTPGGPRTCGDGPVVTVGIAILVVWTPRMRGWTFTSRAEAAEALVDPARAGMDPPR